MTNYVGERGEAPLSPKNISKYLRPKVSPWSQNSRKDAQCTSQTQTRRTSSVSQKLSLHSPRWLFRNWLRFSVCILFPWESRCKLGWVSVSWICRWGQKRREKTFSPSYPAPARALLMLLWRQTRPEMWPFRPFKVTLRCGNRTKIWVQL